MVYKKDGMHSYMVMEGYEEMEDDYKLQMILENNIEGLLPLKVKQINNRNELYYDITSKISMKDLFAREKIKGKDIEDLIIGLSNGVNGIREYLLDVNRLILSTEYIYVNAGTGVYSFCYCPYGEGTLQSGLKELFEEILDKLDHRDKKAVVLAYGMQQIVSKDNVTVTELLEYIKNNKAMEIQEKINQEANETNNILQEKQEKVEECLEKKSLFTRIKNIFSRKKYKGEEELMEEWVGEFEELEEAKTYNREADNEELKTEEYEEATILLSSGIEACGIVLRSTDIENPITIIPNGFPCIIGKSARSSDVKIEERFISRVHARLYEETDGYYIEDLNSSNGTYLNGQRLKAHELTTINIGDKVIFADLEFIVE